MTGEDEDMPGICVECRRSAGDWGTIAGRPLLRVLRRRLPVGVRIMTPRDLAAKWAERPVNDEADGREFIADCERALGLGFHPDTRMYDYVTRQPGETVSTATFTDVQGEILDDLLDRTFKVLGEVGVDVYEVSLEHMLANHPELSR